MHYSSIQIMIKSLLLHVFDYYLFIIVLIKLAWSSFRISKGSYLMFAILDSKVYSQYRSGVTFGLTWPAPALSTLHGRELDLYYCQRSTFGGGNDATGAQSGSVLKVPPTARGQPWLVKRCKTLLSDWLFLSHRLLGPLCLGESHVDTKAVILFSGLKTGALITTEFAVKGWEV